MYLCSVNVIGCLCTACVIGPLCTVIIIEYLCTDNVIVNLFYCKCHNLCIVKVLGVYVLPSLLGVSELSKLLCICVLSML